MMKSGAMVKKVMGKNMRLSKAEEWVRKRMLGIDWGVCRCVINGAIP